MATKRHKRTQKTFCKFCAFLWLYYSAKMKNLFISVALALLVAGRLAAQQDFAPEEATISAAHAAFAAGKTTCVQLVRAYLNRIEAYDHRGPALNAIITINPPVVGGPAPIRELRTPRCILNATAKSLLQISGLIARTAKILGVLERNSTFVLIVDGDPRSPKPLWVGGAGHPMS